MRSRLATLVLLGCAPNRATDATDDADGDGYPVPEDCDDHRAAVNPSATELCDDLDNDCDGEIDESDAFDAPGWFRDHDGDGFGDPSAIVYACARPDGVAENGADCDDQDAWVHPGAREICDPLDRDEDCDGLADDADESASHRRVFYGDADGDGFG
ncbi:MAG: putative metal-binding motif-containing protein, partial [Myxococcota bacterium]|nr:putative metal-binding motif-containing protein [Myxococcota bacterium]